MEKQPLYRKVYEMLREQIAAGNYRAGDLLPSENELCAAYGATRPTVRKALERLVADGAIVRRQEKGSIVKGAPKGIGILSLKSTTTAVGQGVLTTRIILRPEIRPWEEAFSFPLSEEEKKRGCIYFERLRLVNGVPLFFDITMLPNEGLPRFTALSLENRSLFGAPRTRYQPVGTGGTQQLFSIRADKRLQACFGIKAGHPVLQLNRKIDTNRVGFHIYSQVFCVTQGYGLIGTF